MKLNYFAEDRTFKYWVNKGHGSDFTEGLWKNINETLILNSRNLNKDDEIVLLCLVKMD